MLQMDNSNLIAMHSLTLLFVFDKMEIPLNESSLTEMCCAKNNWISYMDFRPALHNLVTNKWIFTDNPSDTRESSFDITADGRTCLSYLHYKIPASVRSQIVDYANANRMLYRRRQEYYKNYYEENGEYIADLKILESNKPMLEIKLHVDSKPAAKNINFKWEENAAKIYQILKETLIDSK